jgi:hypothetical protein
MYDKEAHWKLLKSKGDREQEKREQEQWEELIWSKHIMCMCEIPQWNPFVQLIYTNNENLLGPKF